MANLVATIESLPEGYYILKEGYLYYCAGYEFRQAWDGWHNGFVGARDGHKAMDTDFMPAHLVRKATDAEVSAIELWRDANG